jgi:hypothetical protein
MRKPVGGIRQVSIDLAALEGVNHEGEHNRDRLAHTAEVLHDIVVKIC